MTGTTVTWSFTVPARSGWLRAGLAGLAVICCAAVSAAQEGGPDPRRASVPLSSIELPGPAADLALAVGLPADTPRARVLLDVIRLAHAAPPGQSREVDAARAALNAWIDAAIGRPSPQPASSSSRSAGTPGDRLVPSPLDESSWVALASRLDLGTAPAAAIVLRDRRLSLLYVGLLGAFPETRAFLAAHPELLETIARHHAAAFSAFGRSLVVQDGRMRLPGGPRFDALWQDVVGEKPTEPEPFIRRALAEARGHRAWFLDVVTHLNPAAQRFVMAGPPPGSDLGSSPVPALARLFASQDARWSEDRPFARPALDGHVVLTSLGFSEAGAWVGPASQRFWRDAFEGREPGDDESRWTSDVLRSPPVDAAFLVGEIVGIDADRSQSRLAAVRFAQRRFTHVGQDQLADALRATQAMMAAPALVLVLERVGLVEPLEYARAFGRARAVTQLAREANTPVALAQFQAALAIVDALRQRHALAPDPARRLVASLVELEPGRDGYGSKLADWLRGQVLPRLSAGTTPTDDADAIVLRGLAGPFAGPDGPEITWEGLRYRFNPAPAEARRLAAVLRIQRAPGLADALSFADAVQAVIAAAPPTASSAALQTLEAAAARLGHLRQPLFVANPSPTSAAAIVAPVLDRARDGRRRALSSRDRDLLQATADAALTEALLAFCYARHFGDPQGPISLVPDVARRHLLVPERGQSRTGVRDAWQPPVSRSGGGSGGWRIAGSLLMLEHALADLALQPVDSTTMPAPPRLSEAGQQLLAMSVSAMDPWALDDEVADVLVSQIGRAREQLRVRCSPGDGEPPGRWSRWRVAVAQWACVHDPESVDRLWTLTDLALEAPGAGASNLDRWGGLEPLLEGPLAPRWPPDRPLDDLEGRPSTGRSVAPFVELSLRILPVLRANSLPAVFLPAVLSTAMFDLLHDAPLAYPDDWFRLARRATELTDEQIEDYIAAQASRGALVPVNQER